MLISQYVTPSSGRPPCLHLSDVHTIPDCQPQLLHKHRQIVGVRICLRVELLADSLEQEVMLVTQQGVPIVAQVELSVPPPRVDLVDADKLPVPGISLYVKERE